MYCHHLLLNPHLHQIATEHKTHLREAEVLTVPRSCSSSTQGDWKHQGQMAKLHHGHLRGRKLLMEVVELLLLHLGRVKMTRSSWTPLPHSLFYPPKVWELNGPEFRVV